MSEDRGAFVWYEVMTDDIATARDACRAAQAIDNS